MTHFIADLATENAWRYRTGLLVALSEAIVQGDPTTIDLAAKQISASAEDVIGAAWMMIEGLRKEDATRGSAQVAYVCLGVHTGLTNWDAVEAAIDEVVP